MFSSYPINFISNGGGGGGDTDLSIANVKIDNQALGGSAEVYASLAFDENELGEGSPTMSMHVYDVLSSAEKTLKVIMYKGAANLEIDSPAPIRTSSSGDIEPNGFGGFIVTGDGTISVFDDSGSD